MMTIFLIKFSKYFLKGSWQSLRILNKDIIGGEAGERGLDDSLVAFFGEGAFLHL